ncbi:hypothetical protein SM0020_20646 [Sinorhizobium meliloti CCNWSX0020]|uniref:Uncharacterized protein n=1 Tax=Sinorhizobium meliloti CCNWSX0020 TaxID=1107881 RepID=H0G3S8_RHIML|nr:hypothetical protein SM0020_20646 [Sinorhizobium meliloti CCNWSX0020]PII38875.1 hypothetical protein T190_13820 [Sinorhizobium meliloti CCBAU 01290]
MIGPGAIGEATASGMVPIKTVATKPSFKRTTDQE